MNKNSISEYKERFKQKSFEYIKNEKSNCSCSSERYSTQRYVHRWPCDTHTRKCDFGMNYPQTLESIARQHNTLLQKDLSKWRSTNIKCPNHSPVCLNEEIKELRITCSLCQKCCKEMENTKSAKVVPEAEETRMKGCFCDACWRSKEDQDAIRSNKEVLEDESGLEFFMRERQRIHRLQDQMEKCRARMQPNKILQLTQGRAEEKLTGGGGKDKCHNCGDVFDCENDRVGCLEEDRLRSDPIYCACLKKQAYDIACINCKQSKDSFIVDCNFDADARKCNEKCVKMMEDREGTRECGGNDHSGSNELNHCDTLCKDPPQSSTACSKPSGAYQEKCLPCNKDPCQQRLMQHLLHTTPPSHLLKLQPGEMECMRDDLEVDVLDTSDFTSLQRIPLHNCSQLIPSDASFDYYPTTADIHKLRYMQNDYTSFDDWYTVY